MPPKPKFDTIGDEPIEARIVAWVLGDASAFEATELERLCHERPELLVFRRRMLALHDLLTEVETTEADHSAKLPPAKRRALDEIFGDEKPAILFESQREARIRGGWRRRLLAIAAILILMAVLGGGALFTMRGIGESSRAVAAASNRQAANVRKSEMVVQELRKAVRQQEDTVEKRGEAIKRGLDAQDYVDAKRELDAEQALLQQMKMNLMEKEIAGKMPDQSLAMKDQAPISRSREVAGERAGSGAFVPLKPDYPPQLIEGTPKSIILGPGKTIQGTTEWETTLAARNAETKPGGDPAGRQLAPDLAANSNKDGDFSRRVSRRPNTTTPAAPAAPAPAAEPAEPDDALLSEAHPSVLTRKPRPSSDVAVTSGKRVVAEGARSTYSIPDASDSFGEMAPSSALAGGLGGSGTGHGFGKAPAPLPPPSTPDVAADAAGKPSSGPASGPALELPRAPAAKRPAEASQLAREDERLVEDKQRMDGKVKAEVVWSGDSKQKQLGFAEKELASADSGRELALEKAELAKPGAGATADLPQGQKPAEPAAGAVPDGGLALDSTMAVPAPPADAPAPPVNGELGVGFGRGSGGGIAGGLGLASGHEMRDGGELSSPKFHFPTENEPDENGRTSQVMPPAPSTPAPINSPQVQNGSALAAGQRTGDAITNGGTIDALIDRAEADHFTVLPKDAVKSNRNTNDADLRVASKESPDEPVRSGAAEVAGQSKATDAVRRGLYTADGNFNLGKYDNSWAEYEKVLQADPNNKAAREGLERIASAKSANYRAAYDQGRAELLTDVDKAWELRDEEAGAPAGSKAKTTEAKSTSDIIREFDAKSGMKPQAEAAPAASTPPAQSGTSPKGKAKPESLKRGSQDAEVAQATSEGKKLALAGENAYTDGTTVIGGALDAAARVLDKKAADSGKSDQLLGLAQREMIRRRSTVAESDRYLVEARDASAKGSYQAAYDNYAKALGLLPDAPMVKDRRDFLRKALGDSAVALANNAIQDGRKDEARTWLGKAMEWDPGNAQARQKVVADVASELAASDAPYSTFSLSISDASFKMARAALARGERPDPASIKVEQFYNAVDYGDPAPGGSEPVAARVEQSAHPVIPGRNLVRVAMRTGAAGRSAAQPLRLTLLVDQSGSMARDDRRAAMEIALKQLGGLLTKNDSVTVIGFSRRPRLLADALPGDQGAKLSAVVNQAASEGGTNMEEAIKLGAQLALQHQTAGAQNRIVLFTDGAANLGDADPSRLADRVAELRQKGLAFDIAGIGTSNLNDQLLAELARHGNGRYCVVGAEKDADGSFARQLAGAFRPAAENVKVQVRFNPQRVGRYKLLGFEEHRLKTEDFRNDAVDAAELAAEEAGVALYQVEPLAEGSGELGEVSVRFRDAASGQMVERSWTIPYDAAAPAFDRATPSMQLAGLALLAAEKLRGGPLAEAIDFKQLSAPRATVKQFYSNSRRVAEMLEVVTKL